MYAIRSYYAVRRRVVFALLALSFAAEVLPVVLATRIPRQVELESDQVV